MIPRMKVGRGVTGAVRYILGEGRDAITGDLKILEAGDNTRVGWFGGMGFGFDIASKEDADLARRIMEFDSLNQNSPTRKCEKDCVHLTLSWKPGETPGREEMEAAAKGALKTLGMENAKALFAAHTDEGYQHIHIVASKLDPDTGRAYDLKGNYLKLSKWAQQYEIEHGGVVCLRRESANNLRDAITARDAAAVLEYMTQQRATFTAADLERALAKQIKGELSRAQFADQVLGNPEAVRLTEREGGPVTRYTTRTVLHSEQQVLRAAEDLAAGHRHGITDHRKAAVLDQFATMREEQRAAFEHATAPGGLSLIDGQAGTGKSYTMDAIRRAYEEGGYRVIGLAPTNAVAQSMEADGFKKAATVHSELFALNNQRAQWDRRTVVMVDEAAMIDTKMMAALTEQAQAAGAKLILVGDDRQLSSIERGGMFGALKDRYGAAALSEITRQYKQDDRRASAMMAEGNFADAVSIYEKKGAITWTRTQEEARAAAVRQWTADTQAAPEKSRFVFAYTNADVDALNRDLREVQRRRGVLGEDREFETTHGKRAFAEGDRVQFTATEKKLGIMNGAAGRIVGIEGNAITLQLDGKQPKELTFDAGEFKGFRHGYAGTIYKGQGRTLDQTYLYHSEHWRSAASYVALTRHRDKTELFVARNTAADPKQLARQMARVDDRRAASNFIEFGRTQDALEHRPAAPERKSALAEAVKQFTDHEPAARSEKPSPGWTDRGGMVAQQQSATEWAKRGQEIRQPQQSGAERQPPEDFNRIAAAIKAARQESAHAEAFAGALSEKGLHISRVTKEEARASAIEETRASREGRYAPAYREGEYLVMSEQGQVYRLSPRTTGENFRDIQKFMATLDAKAVSSLEETKRKIEEREALRQKSDDPFSFASRTKEEEREYGKIDVDRLRSDPEYRREVKARGKEKTQERPRQAEAEREQERDRQR